MECYSCKEIQRNTMALIRPDNFGELLYHESKPFLSMCCEHLFNIPRFSLEETPEESFHKYVDMINRVDEECKNIKEDSKRIFTKGCVNCPHFQFGSYQNDGRVHYVIFGMYPSPCQCRCIYCDAIKKDQNADTYEARKLYDHMFAVLDLALGHGLIADDAFWNISPGEITIHPYHDRIMGFVKERNAIFCTNCIKFDEDIAQNLHDCPNSSILFSIDAGTQETWKRVKGLDNFEKVKENLLKYYARTTRPGQIQLKYIVLPGINDTYEDFTSIAEIMKSVDVKHLTVSRDFRNGKKYNMTESETVNLTESVARLLAVLTKNELEIGLFYYTPEERKLINAQANEMIAKNLV